MSVTSRMDETIILDPHSPDGLRGKFRGNLVTETSPGYDAARAVWNGMIDRRPQVIAECVDSADVVAALAFARRHNLPVTVRGGGHSAAGKSVCDGVVIDLGPMKGVSVDTKTRIVTAQPGLLWGDYDHETQSYGLATPGGLVSHTGIAGFALGGGVGWLSRQHGLTCDNLVGANVVLADGTRVTCSEQENPDLLWALKGGGGNFGVVTEFRLKSYPVGPMILGGAAIWPMAQAKDVLKEFATLAPSFPEQLGIVAALSVQGPHPMLPDAAVGERMLTIAYCWDGDHAEGRAVLKPLLDFGDPVFASAMEIPYTAIQSFQDRMAPHGRRAYWKSGFVNEITDAVADILIGHAVASPSPHNAVELALFTGAATAVEPEATAFGAREGTFIFNINSAWDEAADDEANVSYTRAFFEALEPHSTGGVYVNFLSDEGEERVRAAYGSGWDRLAELKHKYDPDNVFSGTQNIVPSVSAR